MRHSTSLGRSTQRLFRLAASTTALPACLSSFACTSDTLSIGTDDAATEPLAPESPACGDGTVRGNVFVANQVHIDALTDCEVIRGDLWISAFPGMDLRPLGSLRVVHGNLIIGPNLTPDRWHEGVPNGFVDATIESLEGLESLEQANAISLSGVSAPNLSAFASLSSLRRDPASRWPQGGYLYIARSDGLVNLAGLESLGEWDSLMLTDNPNLESLAGLSAPLYLGSIELEGLPKLRDVSSLAPVRWMDEFVLADSQVENLDGFRVERIGSLVLTDNPALVDLDGLHYLAFSTWMMLARNDKLERLPELPYLVEVETLQVDANANLRSIPAYGGTSAEITRFEISDNALLVEVAAPIGRPIGREISIYGNPSLTRLDLKDFKNVDALTIRENPALTELDIAALQTVDALEVLDNPRLSTATLAQVRTFASNISGNLDSPAP